MQARRHFDRVPRAGTECVPDEFRDIVDGKGDAHVVAQDQFTRAFASSARKCQELARELRREFVRPVTRAGSVLFGDDQSLLRSLTMPRVNDYERLVQAALSIAGHAEDHKAAFIEAGFEADFVDRVRAAAASLRKEMDEKNAELGRRAAATAGIHVEYRQARKIVRLLDTMVAPRLEKSPERLAQWRTLSRFVPGAQPEEAGNAPAAAPPATGTTGGAVPPAPQLPPSTPDIAPAPGAIAVVPGSPSRAA